MQRLGPMTEFIIFPLQTLTASYAETNERENLSGIRVADDVLVCPIIKKNVCQNDSAARWK